MVFARAVCCDDFAVPVMPYHNFLLPLACLAQPFHSIASPSLNNFASRSTPSRERPCLPAMNRLRLLCGMPVFLAMAYMVKALVLMDRFSEALTLFLGCCFICICIYRSSW